MNWKDHEETLFPSFEELLSKLDRQRPGGGRFPFGFEPSFNIVKTTPRFCCPN